MRIALCLYSQVRTWSFTKQRLLPLLRDRDIDIYIHTWDDNGITPEYFSDLNPKRVVVENFTDVTTELELLGDEKHLYLHLARKRFLAIDLVVEEYDCIMVMRFDSVWDYIPTVIPEDGDIYNNSTFSGGVPGDWGFFGKSRDIVKLFDNFLDKTTRELIAFCPHTLVKNGAEKHNFKLLPYLDIRIVRRGTEYNKWNNGQYVVDADDNIVPPIVI
jgi:hypothetical protein